MTLEDAISEIHQLKQSLVERDHEIDKLQRLLKQAQKNLYGRKSEKLPKASTQEPLFTGYPVAHPFTGKLNMLPGKHLLLAVKRQVIHVLGKNDVGEKSWAGLCPLKRLHRGRELWGKYASLAARAGALKSDVLYDLELRRNMLKYLGLFLPNH